MLGLGSTSIYQNLLKYLEGKRIEIPEVEIKIPEVESNTPIIIRVCPEPESGKYFLENGWLYFSKEKAINCTHGGGGG
jgi:hypothetical protein